MKPYRLAAVSFLNTVPLIERFIVTNDPRVVLERALPSRLPSILARGGADVGLLPVVEIFRGGCEVVGRSGIAGRGAVDSVKLFHGGRRDAAGDPAALRRLQRIAVDRGSRTSVALLRVLLAELAGAMPEFVEVEPTVGRALEPGEGVLVIGDRCFEFDRWRREDSRLAPSAALDLGQAWLDLTGLPFVFAAWAGGPGFHAGQPAAAAGLSSLLDEARDYGLENLDAIVAREAAAGRLGRDGEAGAAALDYYFRTSLRYRLGDEELAGMKRFQAMCAHHGLVQMGPDPVMH